MAAAKRLLHSIAKFSGLPLSDGKVCVLSGSIPGLEINTPVSEWILEAAMQPNIL